MLLLQSQAVCDHKHSTSNTQQLIAKMLTAIKATVTGLLSVFDLT